jgi:hypothetical protein
VNWDAVEAIGTWVGGLGGVGAFVWLIKGQQHEVQRRQEDIRALRDAQREQQDAQARTVVVHDAGCGGTQYMMIGDFSVTVGNYGAHPITNVVSRLTHKETGKTIGDGTSLGAPAPLTVLEAGKRHRSQWQLTGWNFAWPTDAQSHQLPDLFDLDVQFTDVNGIRWVVQPGLGQQPSRVYDMGP